jgi:hypothetical protein
VIQFGFDLLCVISFEGVSVDTPRALEFTPESNRRSQFNNRGFILDFLCRSNSFFDRIDIVISVLDVLGMPPVRLEAFQDVLGESAGGVPVDRNVVVVVDTNQVSQLQVSCEGGGFAGYTLLSTAIAKEAVGVIVYVLSDGDLWRGFGGTDEVKAGFVEDGGGVSLCNGQADGIAKAYS